MYFGFSSNIILSKFFYRFKDIIILLSVGFLAPNKIISNLSKNLALNYNTSIVYIDMLLFLLITIFIYYIFIVIQRISNQENPRKYRLDILHLSIPSLLKLINKSLLLNLILLSLNYFNFTDLYLLSYMAYMLLLDDILDSFLYFISFIEYLKFSFFNMFIFSMNPLSSGSGKKDDPIDLTNDEDEDDEQKKNENENHSVEYFQDLLKKRDNYLEEYEYYNKKWKDSSSNEDKAIMDEYGDKLDQVELEIEELKEKEGFADPADFINDPDDE